MDPQQCWNDLTAALAAGRSDDAQESAESLLAWLRRGGFPPQTQSGRQLPDAFNRAVALAACSFLVLQEKPPCS
ncbi:MAG: hypothetical protein KF708_06835 [Pirellulales bacterium]|nr:hypothetical protein [Pirellulales bacterium]